MQWTSAGDFGRDDGPAMVTSDVGWAFGLLERPDWHRDAACREHPELEWFPDRGVSTAPAKAVCSACFVREECLAAGMGQKFGVWGGRSERERRKLRTGRPSPNALHRKRARLIRRLFEAGVDASAIAAMAGMDTGRVRLIIDYRKKATA